MHVMRPDRVYRTGVLAPMVGYQPSYDVQANAQAFTQGPPLGTMLQGLRGFGPFARLRLRAKAWIASKRANAFVAAGTAGLYGPGAPQVVAQQVAPQMQAQMLMLMHLPARGSSTGGDAAYEIARRRWNEYYRAG